MSSTALDLFYGAEPLLIAVSLFFLWRSKQGKRLPALCAYLSLRLFSFIALECVLHMHSFTHVSRTTAYDCYFWTYWTSYIAGAIAVFFVLHELFNRAMEPLPGLKRLGSIAFRWITCVSMVAALASVIAPGVPGDKLLVSACDQIMRCESIFMLCLLLFLMIAAGRLGLSYGSRIFGISFGFGVLGTSNLVASALLANFRHNMVSSSLSVMDTGASILALAVWSLFFIKREPARRAVHVPLVSPLARWNEIAASLGARAAAPAGSDLFLQDVERVVDRVLIKNSLNVAS